MFRIGSEEGSQLKGSTSPRPPPRGSIVRHALENPARRAEDEEFCPAPEGDWQGIFFLAWNGAGAIVAAYDYPSRFVRGSRFHYHRRRGRCAGGVRRQA